jgi:hypothetical protein
VLISDCGIQSQQQQFSNPQSEIGNPQCLKTPRRGQSAESPDRFIVKKRLISRRFFSE